MIFDAKATIATLAVAALFAGAAPAVAQSETAIRDDIVEMVREELEDHIGHETVIFRLWSYPERDGGLTFCGVAMDQNVPARQGRDRSNFVFSLSPTHERFFVWQATVDAMRGQGCGRTTERRDLMSPEVNGTLANLRAFEPPQSPTAAADTSHIPKDSFGNVLVTDHDKADPRCSVGASYAYRIFAEREENVISRSGEPAAHFNDYTRPFGRCFNRMGQAIMQDLLATTEVASDRLWIENELRRLRMRSR